MTNKRIPLLHSSEESIDGFDDLLDLAVSIQSVIYQHRTMARENRELREKVRYYEERDQRYFEDSQKQMGNIISTLVRKAGEDVEDEPRSTGI